MKNRKLMLINIGILILGVLFTWGIYRYEKSKIEKSPKIDFNHKLDSVNIKTVEFKRNALYSKTGIRLNGILYDTYLNKYSLFYQFEEEDSLPLKEISPPFLLTKIADSDTLWLIKDDKKYYSILNEGIEREEKR